MHNHQQLHAQNLYPQSNSLHELIARKRRRERRRSRKRVISSGWKTNVLNGLCLSFALLLCLAHFEHLQADADYKLIEFESFNLAEIKQGFQGVIRHGHWISGAMFLLLVVGIKTSKTRFSFLTLLALFAWPINAFLHVEQNHHHDYLISRLALSAFTALIMTAIVFLPKKLKRRKHPNTFRSAFSIASTPTSQQSSQLNASQCSLGDRTIDFDDNATVFSGRTFRSSANTNPFVRNRLANAQNGPFTMNNGGQSNTVYSDTMSLRSGKTFATGLTQSNQISSSSKPRTQEQMKWREKHRESTPLREVRELIDDLLINNSTEEEKSSDEESGATTAFFPSTTWELNSKRPLKASMLSNGAVSPSHTRRAGQQGPFSSLTFNPAVSKRIASINGPANSQSTRSFTNGSPKSAYNDGTSCSSLSSAARTSSPFRRHL